MASNPNQWETYGWKGASTGALPTEPDMSSDEWDHPTAEPKEDINAQLMDLASDSERQAVYLAPDQQEDRGKNPKGSVVIEDFDGKGGKLIARDQAVADKALQDQTAGRSLQQIIGELTLAGDGKPNNQDAIVVQKQTPDGAVMRESVQATQADAEAKGQEWGGGEDINFTDMPSAIKRRKDLIMQVAGEQGLSAQLVAGVMATESAGDRYAESGAGAQGLMQLMPGTAKDMGVDDVWDEEQNARGGAKYLRKMRDKYEGDREKMLAAYNWGPSNLDRHLASLPPGADWKEGLPRETSNYIEKIGIGGTSEALAYEMTLDSGYAVPTEDSMAGAVDTVFDKNVGYLADDDVLGQLDWQQADQKRGGEGGGQQEYNPDDWETYGPKEGVKEDDYGWGIKHAMMRGLIRAGQLIDLAQGDAEEYAEGAESLKNWEVSEEDASRLAELQESEGFWDALGYYIVNPALAMQVVVESLPMSAAPLAGGLAGAVGGTAVGGPVGTVIGGMTGAGLGSFGTEYLASIGDALQEHGVDATDPQALKDAFANEELMATARELGRERGIGVAAWDALSMGIAGRIFKPVKALAGAATKTGAVVGGTSEILAQATAGAMGELSAQKIAGQEYDPAAVAGEFIGEIVPGMGEIAINKAVGRDAGGNKPDAPPGTPDDLGDPADTTAAGDVPVDVEASIPEDGDPDVDAEGADRVVETPSPESEAATTSPSPTDESAPVKTQGKTSSEVVEEVPVEEMLAAAADREEAAEQAEREAEFFGEEEGATAKPEEVSPLIDTKTLGPKVTKTIKAQKVQTPIRTAWRGLMNAISERYGTTAAVPGGTFSGTGVAKFFKALQDEIDITTDLPEIKTFLDEVTTGNPAEVIQTLQRLTGQIRASNPTLADAPIDSIAGQVQAAYNNFVEYFDSHQRVGKGKKNKGQKAVKGSSIAMANKLGELSGAVRALLQAGHEAGVLEEAGIGATYGKTMDIADDIADAAQAPTEKKTASGGKERTIPFADRTILDAANNLKEIAEKVVPLLAEAEAKGDKAKAAKTGKGKAKVEETSAATEAPAKPKKAAPDLSTPKGRIADAKAELKKAHAAAEKANKGKGKKFWDMGSPENKAVLAAEEHLRVVQAQNQAAGEAQVQQLERQREVDEQQGADAAYDKLPAKEAKVKKVAKEKAEVKINDLLAKKPEDLTYNELRKVAKHLGVKATGKKETILADVKAWGETAAEAVATPKVTVKKKKKTEKPDVKGASPAEVFDKEQNITGKKAQKLKEGTGKKTIGEAIESLGVSKLAAKRVEGIMGVLDKNGKLELTRIAEEFRRTGDMVRFATQVKDLVGKVPSQALTEAYTEFFLALEAQESTRPETSQDAMDALIDDHLDMTEDERAIAELTGAIEPTFDPDESTVDEWNVPHSERLRSLYDLLGGKLLGKSKAVSKADSNILQRAWDKLRGQFDDVETVKMGEFIDMMLSVLPSNHRFSHLLQQIKKSGLELDVNIITKEDEIVLDAEGKERSKGGGSFTPDYASPENSTVEILTNEDRSGKVFFRTATHELLHAVTVFRYATDAMFRNRIDALWKKSVLKLLGHSNQFDTAVFADLTENNASGAYDYVLEFLMTEPGDVNAATINALYGLTSPKEFMAEAFTNIEFQEVLAGIKSEPHGNLNFMNTAKSFLKVFLNEIKKVLGVSIRNTVLEEVLILSANNFDTAASYNQAAGNVGLQDALQRGKLKRTKKPTDALDAMVGKSNRKKIRAGQKLSSVQVEESIPDKKVRTTVVNDTADAARQRDKTVMQSRETLVEKLKALPRSINLGFMNRDVIERNYRELFARAAKAAGHAVSPLTVYIKMKQLSSQIAEKYAKQATAALQKLQKLDNQTRSKVFTMMRDTTLAQVWPHVPLTDKMNAHLWSKPDKKGVTKLSPTLGKAATKARKEWVALNKKNPTAAKLLIEMAMLTKQIQDRKRIEALRTVGKVYELDADIVKRLGMLESREDIQSMFPGMYDKDGSLIDADDTGSRPTDTVIVKGDSKEVKKQKKEKFKAWKEKRAVAKTAEQIVKGTSINGPYFPLRRYGKYVVSSTEEYNEDNEPYVSFHHTRKEAKRVAAGLEDKLKIPTYVTKKIEAMAIPRDVESVTADLGQRMGKRKDGVSDYMGQRLQAAMIEIMADNSSYASQLKRHGVDGVAADDMGRAFEEYVFVAKYTLGDIATAHEVHQALKDLKSLQSKGAQDVLRQDAATEDEVILIGDVVNELAAQNREDAKDREMSAFQKGVGLIGFFNFLGAPSYWILNATQTLTVTLPYIGAKFGNVVRDGKKISATGAYKSAAATVLKAAKGAKNYEQFKASLPPAAQKVVAALEAEGIIQSTIAHQFGDIMTPSTLTSIQNWAGPVGKATATALKLMETIPEGVEKYNRISTALAIYNLSDGNMVAVADGVQATQFNYDSANRARLMKAAPGWAGGGLRAVITPMMMFKSYGIGLTRLLYGNMAKAAVGKTAKERSEARKLAGGLIVSHSVFGGVAGGMMIAPVQAIVWAFNQAFREAGDEFDPEEAVELYLQDVANDTTAALVSRGLPAALGVDMSKSINLGNLIWMGNDRINLNDAGGVETAMTTALGPVAQWGVTSVREGARLMTGDPRGNWYDFAAAAIPLKLARGTIRGMKYEMEGVGTDTLTFIEADDVSGWIRSAMGFRPTGIAMVTDFEYNEMGRENRRSTRKSTLIDRALRADTARERAAVWEDIQSFNRSLDKRADWINRGDVARLRSRRRSRQRQYDRERR